ncbi:MAG: hypothetical protein KC544_07000 [Gemmatimonadetes bacterium]|nr:hypothetical protein [Gemmatimonadota bacterium]MCB9505311.1 hypothetical protein [Gemmatimonadales bacterium]MCA9762867.1 hypothetical protein [Gemmatimonadota bacterium]MCA9767815.1 hypothetical protein [Gemmatimonadota bacterium]MCB9518019.1 hypothetical protein [Gemmatimonadales bacterium]
MRKATVVALVVLAAAAAAGWWGWTRLGSGERRAMVRIEWSGSASGSARLPGELAWCPITRMATLSAISNDTGLLVALHERDSLAPGPHPVVSPAIQGASPLPNATAAFRWVLDTTRIEGYASVSGMVDIDAVGATADGSMQLRLRKPSTLDTLLVRADFRGLPIVTTAVGCP